MIGSEMIKSATEYKWTFKDLMNMDEIIKDIISLMDIEIKDMVEFLGPETRRDLVDTFLEKATDYTKVQLVHILDDATVDLKPTIPSEEQSHTVVEEKTLDEVKNINKLKEEIKNNTKQL